MSYVYVFDFGDMVKIGESKRPLERLKVLEKGNGVKAVRTFAVNAEDKAEQIEQAALFELRNSLLQGREYFSCSFEIARNVVVNVSERILSRHISGVKVGSVVSDAQKRATAKYNKKAYDRIEIFVKKGTKEKIKNLARERQKSTNTFVVELIEKELEKD